MAEREKSELIVFGGYDKIKELLARKAISAITIDTTVFDDGGMRLDKGLFSQLLQFGSHPANLVLSEVVLREIKRHLTKSIGSKKDRFGRDLIDSAEFVGYDIKYVQEIKSKFEELLSPEDICEAQISHFLAESSAIIVDVDDHLQLGDVVEYYFDGKAPFHKENLKKSEFPDAISLMSLEGWARDAETELVVVSRDGDWAAYCETSEKLHIVKDLATALALFQTPDEAVKAAVEDLRGRLNDDNSEIFTRIEEEIRDFDWASHASHYANSQFEYEEDESYVELGKCFFVDRPDAIKVTDIDVEAVSVIFALQLEGNFVVNYSFQKWDAIDKDYMSMGNGQAGEEFSVSVSVVLRIPNKSIETEDVKWEIEPNTLHFDFGEIEPDWMNGSD
ncbi:PIN domain-containing protein [Janthinobacterium sp.]|uniref:PIN domain-containing protein n=1 Tax=Janthinobacterium sp. TaxID=1871054 RepID=UPI00293D869D|nr:PIN domain-containing protein [Janthinobacterium sp.]